MPPWVPQRQTLHRRTSGINTSMVATIWHMIIHRVHHISVKVLLTTVRRAWFRPRIRQTRLLSHRWLVAPCYACSRRTHRAFHSTDYHARSFSIFYRLYPAKILYTVPDSSVNIGWISSTPATSGGWNVNASKFFFHIQRRLQAKTLITERFTSNGLSDETSSGTGMLPVNMILFAVGHRALAAYMKQ